jgi:hypothetical protein
LKRNLYNTHSQTGSKYHVGYEGPPRLNKLEHLYLSDNRLIDIKGYMPPYIPLYIYIYIYIYILLSCFTGDKMILFYFLFVILEYCLETT